MKKNKPKKATKKPITFNFTPQELKANKIRIMEWWLDGNHKKYASGLLWRKAFIKFLKEIL